MLDEAQLADWVLLAQFAQAYRSLSDTFMDQVDMHRAQGTLLCRLVENDGMTQSEIAERLAVQGATITNMLQRMEEAGLVTRRRDPDDNRLVRVYLTDEGRKIEGAINEQFMKLQAAIFDGINEADRVALRRILKQMLHNMTVKT